MSIYEPSACLCLRGGKMVEFSGKQYLYDTQKFLLCASDLPLLGRVEHCPFLSVSIKFQNDDILEALKEISWQSRAGRLSSSLYFGDMDCEIADAVSRLISLLHREPVSLKHVGRLAIKEILYALILSGAGEFLGRFVMQGTAENYNARAMREIKSRFKEPINMRELAAELGISPSSFYHNFKKITALSPLDFQKRIRLQEARYILQNGDATASQVAFDVGYESPSQFSREYARMFGMLPKAHAQTLRD
ncbi:AraC family transcriptional regulator [uncultured Campylobacter sp.]|uniref:AraC family transcriptional regulator n=1 Tax=uncultured Campylobacter sp. TaxID=218934 RepID=UPI002612D50A|nr:AraC family transcriptional regulator [uncultured Campylobacter sp.]